jgi:hypothetical protein
VDVALALQFKVFGIAFFVLKVVFRNRITLGLEYATVGRYARFCELELWTRARRRDPVWS